MASFPPPLTRPRLPWTRVAGVIALGVATALLLQMAGRMAGTGAWPQREASPYAIVAGDFLYRLGEFVQWQGEQQRQVQWYVGYQYSQLGMGMWEREILREEPSAAALLRLGVVYARQGYREQGREKLLQAMQQDPQRSGLYLALADLYGSAEAGGEHLRNLPALMQELPEWLQDLVGAELYRVLGEEETARAAEQEWYARLGRFGVLVAGLQILGGVLALLGLVAVLMWVVRQARETAVAALRARRPGTGVPPRVSLSPRLPRVPWSLLEAVEVVVVLVFLLVAVSLAVAALEPYLPTEAAGGTLLPLSQALGYCLYMGAAVALAYVFARRARRPWHLLGWRMEQPGLRVWQGLSAYGMVWLGAMVLVGVGLRELMLASASLPPFRGGETLGAYLIYFALVCGIAPVAEELIFRGFVYPGMRQAFSPFWGAVFSGMVFAGAHLPPGTFALLFLTLLGVLLAVLYEKTRSLLPCIVVHAVHNFLAFGLLVAVFAV